MPPTQPAPPITPTPGAAAAGAAAAPPALGFHILTTAYTPWPIFIVGLVVLLIGLDMIIRRRFLLWEVQDRTAGLFVVTLSLPLVLALDFLGFIVAPFLIGLITHSGQIDEVLLGTVTNTSQTLIGYLVPLLGLFSAGLHAYLFRRGRTLRVSLRTKLLILVVLLFTIGLLVGFGVYYDKLSDVLANNAEQLTNVRQAMGKAALPILAATYGGLIFAIFVMSTSVTAPLRKLAGFAERVAEGDYQFMPTQPGGVKDEITTLADVFNIMVDKVREREEKLKQEVAELRIRIDQQKRKQEVSEITGSEFFQDLQARAKEMREQEDEDE